VAAIPLSNRATEQILTDRAVNRLSSRPAEMDTAVNKAIEYSAMDYRWNGKLD